MRSIDQEEALSLFSTLESAGIQIVCLGSWLGCTVALSGRVTVQGNEVSVFTPDNRGRIVLQADTDGLLFWHWEAGEVSPDKEGIVPRTYWGCACVSVSLPLRVPLSMLSGPLAVPRRDKLIFLELTEGFIADGVE
jgi:hypothetical protein